METWFLLNDDFSQQEMMTQRSFVFPNVVSDHDGIRRKNPNQFCFQILCRITSRSDTQIVNSKCVSKFCVGSHQHPTQKKTKPVVLPNFVSDPINIRHKKTKPIVFPSFVSDPVNIRHKNQSLLCFQIWCRIQILCRIPSASDTKKAKPVVFPRFESNPISLWHKNESYQALNADSKTYVFPHFVSDPIRIRHKTKITL